ncbi:MAG TPA: carboxypeptidase-like regulatory domain-containing protein, partial [Bryobacteraceae bacterium]|nr:carboxypeptidase-like regulatory domain-containing protein [Bryobacteraceae bacterium]
MTRFVLALMLAVLPLAAQTSSLQGFATDPEGKTMPDLIVTITNQDTGTSRKTLTDDTGAFSFLQMSPGTYKVDASKPGFRNFTSVAVLQVSSPATLNIRMEIGQVTETVNVVAEVAAVNSQNASVGNAFTETQITQLPLQTRNIVGLLSVQPGVTSTGQVIGAKSDQNNVTLDGVDVNDNQSSTGFSAALPVPLDSIEQFRTTVVGQGADQGRSSGGQVSLITRSGANQFHGSLYEYMRNTLTAANDWFSNRSGVPRAALVRNQYGARLGGRIIRDRVFFFFNWEDRKDRSATAVTRTVPSESFKQGIVKVQLTNGQVATLTPGDVKALDPLGIGASPFLLQQMQKYPVGNDPLSATDKGLNLSVLRFNTPQQLDNRVYVGKLDFNLDKSGKHTAMVRGTLNSAKNDSTVAQMPGQAAASRTIDNSRGLAARYTWVASPRIVNVASYGYTRIGIASTGVDTVVPSFAIATLVPTARPSQRISPTSNFVDDLTWTRGRHTIQFGGNFRVIENDRISSNLPNYSFSRNTLKGLGADINSAVLGYIQKTYVAGAALSSGTNVTNAMGTLLGVVNQYGGTYNFGIDGKSIPFGQNIVRAFANQEYEFYAQDAFKLRRNLTLTYGVRYGLYRPPYEKNGVQVVPTTPLSQFFADRVGGQALGIPSSALPTAAITYDIGGPVNGKSDWYPVDKNNFAPRVAVAWSPEGKGMLGKLLGTGSVIRAGAGVVHDRYGSNLAVTFANSGSPGLATTVAQPVNTDFTTGFRYNGGALPTLPVATGGAFPFTPPTIVGGFTSFNGIASDLRAPYEYLINVSYARPLPKKLSIEVGYVGRLSHKGLLIQDFSQPATLFKDNKSGQTWLQASGIIRNLYNQGITPAQVRANPSILPTVPFFENVFAKAKNYVFNGSATANYYYTVYNTYAGSDLDGLNDMDRLRLADGTCISSTGCNTFFALQSAGLTSWVNAG